jgi:hypothetical protein
MDFLSLCFACGSIREDSSSARNGGSSDELIIIHDACTAVAHEAIKQKRLRVHSR